MKVKVLRSTRYPGVTLIEGDIVDVPNKEAKELIRMGKAVEVEDEIDIDIDLEDAPDFEDMTKEELVMWGEENGIEIDPKLKKSDMIALIEGE